MTQELEEGFSTVRSNSTLEQLYQAYQRVSSQRHRISVPIDAVIKEAGLWDQRNEAKDVLTKNKRLLQLDEGDWASADADTRAVHVTDPMRTENVHGYQELRKLTMMAFTETPAVDRQTHFFELHPEKGSWALTDKGELLKRFAHVGEAELMCERLQAYHAAELERATDRMEQKEVER